MGKKKATKQKTAKAEYVEICDQPIGNGRAFMDRFTGSPGIHTVNDRQSEIDAALKREMKQLSAKTFWARIYVAGDIEVAKQVCREACFREGLCVTVEPCEYIYTGGQETGYVVGLINYPRFPAGREEISDRAKRLATELMDRGFQNSALVMTPEDTEWITRRPESADAGRKC